MIAVPVTRYERVCKSSGYTERLSRVSGSAFVTTQPVPVTKADDGEQEHARVPEAASPRLNTSSSTHIGTRSEAERDGPAGEAAQAEPTLGIRQQRASTP